ncbi:xanthomonadin biosynthesis 3-hydroxybenozate--AMP ligase XanA2 [Paralimibaculum aggregatum]|uniref:Long-chain-fatty-acid--CoA ligase n=1 Tax=Paralimibaculum aggregatum TaxID=3036245 RepID=A0ABQ6LSE6_9RHOB|nr:AMP-binding protein [Limibaculum sp. NKW23]GMG84993.1 xanthomonadin biosynthesis 3-hydroxybenozate--AMP ligase XanA2 [Limibaculum sp. NKW23]
MAGPGDILCFSAAGLRRWDGFAADVAAARARIAGPERVCNLMRDRYVYMVGLAAALLNGQAVVLPASTAPRAVEAALDGPGETLVLGGEAAPEGSARRIGALPDGLAAEPGAGRALRRALETAPGEIHVFTSGSTGLPVRHRKRWATLAGGALVTEAVLAAAGHGAAGAGAQPFAILGSTPHQHMYGLEAAVFSGLAFGRALHRGTIFYPADLEAAVADARAAGLGACVLVTSPAHLRFLEPALAALPEIRSIISATAPLPLALAERIEAAGTRVFEIYGSTETGSLAIRRTAADPLWQPIAGFTLEQLPEGCRAAAPHLDASVLLGDAVELAPDGRFRLLGRLGDMVTVAGKRTSLGTLEAVLAETPGLADGVVLRQRRDEGDWIGVVAVPQAGQDEAGLGAAIRRQFRAHLDPVFLPQRIRFAEALPRGGTGKIPAEAQGALLEALMGAPRG